MAITASKAHISLLNDLIQLDHDAVAAYRAAIERLDNAAFRSRLEEFLGDHERHVRELTALVREMGGDPAKKGDMKQILTKGKVVIGNLSGDKGILQAMRSNEDETNQRYEKALTTENLPPRIFELLDRNLADERRHRAWIVQQLEMMR